MVVKRRFHGASKLEFIAAVILIGILATLLLNRLAYYEEQAEKANMEATASAIKSALRVQMSELMIQGRVRDYALLEQQNPLEWLEQKTVRDNDQVGNAKTDWTLPDAWSFDQTNHMLVYSVKHGDYFVPDSVGQKRVRWQVKLIQNSANADDRPNAGNLTVGVALILVEPYHWF
jgi:type II secretory pathway pseudopilin PulG